MPKFRMETWKLQIEGEYPDEETAIRELADRYMSASKCDPPAEHPLELWAEALDKKYKANADVSKIGKCVFFSVWEAPYGREQWVEKYCINIHPFKANHWWESTKGFVFTECEFRYDHYVPKEKGK